MIKSSYRTYRPWALDFPKYGYTAAVEALDELDEYVVLDLETSGIKAKSSEIVELAIVSNKSTTPLVNTLVRPLDMEAYVISKAREIHGISPDDLQHAPTLAEIWPDVLRIVQSKPLVIFNATFDVPMLRANAMRLGLVTPPLSAICAMRLLTAYLDSDVWYSLDEACEMCGIERGVTHRACNDCWDTVKIIETMKNTEGAQ